MPSFSEAFAKYELCLQLGDSLLQFCNIFWFWRRRCCGAPLVAPLIQIYHHLVCARYQRREDSNGGESEGGHKELDEAHLRIRTIHLLAIVERLHRDAQLFLPIALQEEFIYYIPCPCFAYMERLRRIGDITKVQNQVPM